MVEFVFTEKKIFKSYIVVCTKGGLPDHSIILNSGLFFSRYVILGTDDSQIPQINTETLAPGFVHFLPGPFKSKTHNSLQWLSWASNPFLLDNPKRLSVGWQFSELREMRKPHFRRSAVKYAGNLCSCWLLVGPETLADSFGRWYYHPQIFFC